MRVDYGTWELGKPCRQTARQRCGWQRAHGCLVLRGECQWARRGMNNQRNLRGGVDEWVPLLEPKEGLAVLGISSSENLRGETLWRERLGGPHPSCPATSHSSQSRRTLDPTGDCFYHSSAHPAVSGREEALTGRKAVWGRLREQREEEKGTCSGPGSPFLSLFL